MSEYLPPSVRLAQAAGITISSFLAGLTFSISAFSVPSLLTSPPSLATTNWAAIYNVGKKTGPPVGFLAAASYLYVAYNLPVHMTGDRWKYVVAAVGSVGIGPFTVLFMSKTNEALLTKAASVESGKGKMVDAASKEVMELLRKWRGLNYVRAGLLVGSAGFGAWATLL